MAYHPHDEDIREDARYDAAEERRWREWNRKYARAQRDPTYDYPDDPDRLTCGVCARTMDRDDMTEVDGDWYCTATCLEEPA